MEPSVIYTSEIASPWGKLILGDSRGKICLCDWKNRKDSERIKNRVSRGVQGIFREGSTPAIEKLEHLLELYFNGHGEPQGFSFLMTGTPFQQQIWNCLATIPRGTLWSYSTLAEKANRPDAVRAVASATGANGLSILIPCHRIIGKDKSLTGYAGGLDAKKGLLKLEGIL